MLRLSTILLTAGQVPRPRRQRLRLLPLLHHFERALRRRRLRMHRRHRRRRDYRPRIERDHGGVGRLFGGGLLKVPADEALVLVGLVDPPLDAEVVGVERPHNQVRRDPGRKFNT